MSDDRNPYSLHDETTVLQEAATRLSPSGLFESFAIVVRATLCGLVLRHFNLTLLFLLQLCTTWAG